jgi:hypothetical protein
MWDSKSESAGERRSLTNPVTEAKISSEQSAPCRRENLMAMTTVNILVLILLVLAAILCIFGPVTALGVMFWHWHKELKETSRSRGARTTQTK